MTSREELRLKAQLQQSQQFAADRKKRRMAANIPTNNAIAGEKTTDGKVKAEFADGSTVNAGLLFNASYTQGGVYPAVKRNDGQWFLLNQNHQPIRKVDDEEEVVEEVTPIKILFYDSTDRGLYIGGHREEPTLVFTLPAGAVIEHGKIDSTGPDEDDWIVSISYLLDGTLESYYDTARSRSNKVSLAKYGFNPSLDWEYIEPFNDVNVGRGGSVRPVGHGIFVSNTKFNPDQTDPDSVGVNFAVRDNIPSGRLESGSIEFNSSRGQGQFVYTFDSNQTGIITVYYHMYGVPDELILEWNGNIVSTNGPVIGSGQLSINKTSAFPTTVFIRVNASQFDSLWDIEVSAFSGINVRDDEYNIISPVSLRGTGLRIGNKWSINSSIDTSKFTVLNPSTIKGSKDRNGNIGIATVVGMMQTYFGVIDRYVIYGDNEPGLSPSAQSYKFVQTESFFLKNGSITDLRIHRLSGARRNNGTFNFFGTSDNGIQLRTNNPVAVAPGIYKDWSLIYYIGDTQAGGQNYGTVLLDETGTSVVFMEDVLNQSGGYPNRARYFYRKNNSETEITNSTARSLLHYITDDSKKYMTLSQDGLIYSLPKQSNNFDWTQNQSVEMTTIDCKTNSVSTETIEYQSVSGQVLSASYYPQE